MKLIDYALWAQIFATIRFTIVTKCVNKLGAYKTLYYVVHMRHIETGTSITPLHMSHACFGYLRTSLSPRNGYNPQWTFLFLGWKMYKTEHIYWMPKTLSINIIDSELKARVINWHVPTTRVGDIYSIWEGIGTEKERKKRGPRERGSKALRALYFACPAVIKSKIESKWIEIKCTNFTG